MEPCKQWICDECGKLIEKPKDGWLEWLSEGPMEGYYGFRIVHHKSASPKKDGCYEYSKHRGRKDMHLKQFLVEEGIIRLLSFVDIGSPFSSDTEHVLMIEDLQEWTELYRRLYIPYYEEARLYWAQAIAMSFFESLSEVAAYLPETLKDMIERFK